MQKHPFSLISLFFLLLLSQTPAYANDCDDIDDMVHCSFVKGLSNKITDGRYIKAHVSYIDATMVSCMTETEYSYLPQLLAKEGTYSDQYSICTDSSGIQCEPIGTDVYTITRTGEKNSYNHEDIYTSEPKIYSIDILAVKNKYPQCTTLFSAKNKKPLLHPRLYQWQEPKLLV